MHGRIYSTNPATQASTRYIQDMGLLAYQPKQPNLLPDSDK